MVCNKLIDFRQPDLTMTTHISIQQYDDAMSEKGCCILSTVITIQLILVIWRAMWELTPEKASTFTCMRILLATHTSARTKYHKMAKWRDSIRSNTRVLVEFGLFGIRRKTVHRVLTSLQYGNTLKNIIKLIQCIVYNDNIVIYYSTGQLNVSSITALVSLINMSSIIELVS